jgi:hypothetical protein
MQEKRWTTTWKKTMILNQKGLGDERQETGPDRKEN